VFAPQVRLRSFDRLDRATQESVVRLLLEALVTTNIAYLRAHPEAPWLYASGVTYAEEAEGVDEWTDIPETLRRGVGDCEDLAAWRIAELRVRSDELALPRVTVETFGARALYHVIVKRAGGCLEDPSRVLGLR
jgi:hypothetical protein